MIIVTILNFMLCTIWLLFNICALRLNPYPRDDRKLSLLFIQDKHYPAFKLHFIDWIAHFLYSLRSFFSECILLVVVSASSMLRNCCKVLDQLLLWHIQLTLIFFVALTTLTNVDKCKGVNWHEDTWRILKPLSGFIWWQITMSIMQQFTCLTLFIGGWC